MHPRRLACLCLLTLAALPTISQDLGVYADTLNGPQPYVLQSFIQPGTEAVFHRDRKLDSLEYRIDYRFGRLWVATLTAEDTLIVHYRTWGLVLQDEYSAPLIRAEVRQAGDSVVQTPQHVTALHSPGMSLSRTGSITRGVLAGNYRDAIIESGLNVQLEGTVAENVQVQAVLTDESTPILPEGTTQRLSELDRVYIEIESTPGLARLGDFEAAFTTSTFARLGRKVQGIGLSAQSPVKGTSGTLQAVGAVSRGTYRRQRLKVVNGVQGPYRLFDEQNQLFIFIVPGSEEVYLNGQRLQRGQTQDYVIDYATGEITLTANRIVHHHHRLVVEYQYRTTEFTRSLTGVASDIDIGQRSDGLARASVGVTYLREADARTLNEALGFTADDEALLMAAGDSTALRTGAVLVQFDPEAPYVQYTRRDTLVGEERVPVFSAITQEPDGPVYRISFTRIGQGRGSYVRRGRSTNGLVYEWRGPGLGDYDPVRVLPRPREQRMLDLRGTVAPVPFLELFGEWAQSVYDQNRLSDLHKNDDFSAAYAGGLRLTPVSTGLGTVALSAHRRHTGAGFASFSRIRTVEFERLWNLNAQQTAATRTNLTPERETIDEVTADWQASPQSGLSLTAGRLALG